MKQTAVKWLAEQLSLPEYGDNPEWFQKIIEQAKQIEKEQIIDAYTHDRALLRITSEQYYNQNYCNEPKTN